MDRRTEAELVVLEVLSKGKLTQRKLFKEIQRYQAERKKNLWKFITIGDSLTTEGLEAPRLEEIIFSLMFVGYIRCKSVLNGMFFEDQYEITESGRRYLIAGGDLRVLLR